MESIEANETLSVGYETEMREEKEIKQRDLAHRIKGALVHKAIWPDMFAFQRHEITNRTRKRRILVP